MRAVGTPKVLSWRWAPCLALALGACCFATFAMLVIPDRIGSVAAPVPGSTAFYPTSTSAPGEGDGSSRFSSADARSSTATTFSSLPSQQGASHAAADGFPKRGFSPPLERPEPPPPLPPSVPQQPVLQVTPVAAPAPVPPLPEAAAPPTPEPPAAPQAAATLVEQGVRNAD